MEDEPAKNVAKGERTGPPPFLCSRLELARRLAIVPGQGSLYGHARNALRDRTLWVPELFGVILAPRIGAGSVPALPRAARTSGEGAAQINRAGAWTNVDQIVSHPCCSSSGLDRRR